jgi:stage II sporulation protein P
VAAVIYEKRNGTDRAENKIKSHTVFPETRVFEEAGDTNVASFPKSTFEKTDTPHRKKRRFAKGAERLLAGMLVICIAIGVAYADVKLLDSAILVKTAELSQSFADAVLERETDIGRDISRTLYTLDYKDEEKTAKAEESAQETFEAREASVDTADEIQGYADGERLLPITEMNLASDSPLSITNETNFSPDVKLLSQTKPSPLEGVDEADGPLVLVLHTHACESYTQYDTAYPENEQTRSKDTSRNVVAVGEAICNTLADFGVSAVHCTRLHDGESFINAYSNSAASVKSYLEEYPSIRFVIDVHRDAVIRDDGESIKAVAEISGEKYAQLMFVVGTNQLGHNHPDWQENLSLALTLQKSISDTYPSLCRSINLRNVPFNQQLAQGYLLLEVGTSANTLDEALRSARAFGENLARVIAAA